MTPGSPIGAGDGSPMEFTNAESEVQNETWDDQVGVTEVA